MDIVNLCVYMNIVKGVQPECFGLSLNILQGQQTLIHLQKVPDVL